MDENDDSSSLSDDSKKMKNELLNHQNKATDTAIQAKNLIEKYDRLVKLVEAQKTEN